MREKKVRQNSESIVKFGFEESVSEVSECVEGEDKKI
jgi:hypothetical protein